MLGKIINAVMAIFGGLILLVLAAVFFPVWFPMLCVKAFADSMDAFVDENRNQR